MAIVSTKNESFVNAWLVVCCVLALPLVYRFEQQFYEAATLLVAGVGYAVFSVFKLVGQAGEKIMYPDFVAFPAVCRAQGNCGEAALYFLFISLPLTVVMIAVALYFIAILLPLAIVGGILWFIATHAGWPRYVLDLFIVGYVGMFYYGVLFPLLWTLAEPLVAHTLGELAYQRVRARVYGERPRFSQPLYLVIALVGLIGGGVRIGAPLGSVAAAKISIGWHEVSDPVFRPTPPEWPKVFQVPAGQTVATGIMVPAQGEVGIATTADVSMVIGQTEIARVGAPSGNALAWCVVSWKAGTNCAVHWAGAPVAGELKVRSLAAPTTVTVPEPPRVTNRHWLAAGEIYEPITTWFDKDDGLAYCAGSGISYRTRSSRGASAWQPLDPDYSCGDYEKDYDGSSLDGGRYPPGVDAKTEGHLELRAAWPTWVQRVGAVRSAVMLPIWAHSDTEIPVRPGDRFRIRGEGCDVTLLNTGGVIPAGRTVDFTATWRGTIKLRPKDTWYKTARIMIVERGPEWK